MLKKKACCSSCWAMSHPYDKPPCGLDKENKNALEYEFEF